MLKNFKKFKLYRLAESFFDQLKAINNRALKLIGGMTATSIFLVIAAISDIGGAHSVVSEWFFKDITMEDIRTLKDKNDWDEIALKASKLSDYQYNNEKKYLYFYTRALLSYKNPLSDPKRAEDYLKEIPYSSTTTFRAANSFLLSIYQSNIDDSFAKKEIGRIADEMIAAGYTSPRVYAIKYLAHTLRTDKSHHIYDRIQGKIAFQPPSYYLNAINNLKGIFDREIKADRNIVTIINTQEDSIIQDEYLIYSSLIGALHGSAAVSSFIYGDSKNSHDNAIKYCNSIIKDSDNNYILVMNITGKNFETKVGNMNYFNFFYGFPYLNFFDAIFNDLYDCKKHEWKEKNQTTKSYN